MTTTHHSLPTGVLPVVQLPYNPDFSIDWKTYAMEIDWLIEQGADGLVLAMVTEILRLSDREREELTERTVELAMGRVPVIASVGAESTAVMQERARHAETAGVAAVMAIPPCLARLSSRAVVDYFQALLDTVSVPVIVQDASGYVGNSIPVPILAELWEKAEGRIGFKPEAQPLAANHQLLMELTHGKAPVYEGTAGIGLWGGFSRGLVGTMPGGDVPWAIRRIWDLLSAGKEAEAFPLHAALSALVSLMSSLDAYLAVEKHLLVEQGIFHNTLVRGPVGFTLDPGTEREAMAAFQQLRKLYS